MGPLRNWILRLFYRTRPGPQLRLCESSGWTFETRPGSGKVTMVYREANGSLRYQQTIHTDSLLNVIAVARQAIRVADEFTPTILPLSRHPDDRRETPDRFPVARPKLTLLRAN